MLTVGVNMKNFRDKGLDTVARKFDKEHTQLFTFALDADHELVNLAGGGPGQGGDGQGAAYRQGTSTPLKGSKIGKTKVYADGKDHDATIYDRRELLAGNRVRGPAIITEMDSTTLILPKYYGEVDRVGNILIRPVN